MRRVIIIIGILLAIFLILYYCGCLSNECPTKNEDDVKMAQPFISPNQIVVEFKNPTIDKDSVRAKYGVTRFETCHCEDLSRELWTLDLTKITPEGAVKNLSKKESEDGGMDGDYQFIFQLPAVENDSLLAVDLVFDVLSIYPNQNFNSATDASDEDLVNIVIMDTGIIPNYFAEEQQFFSTIDDSDCPSPNGGYGWNFRDNDRDISDEHGHGTYIAKIISSELQKSGIKYRILPLKIFDKKGITSYWDIVCAMNYVKKLGNIDLVNASFGFYGDLKNQSVLKDLIDDLSAKTLVLASAGNVDHLDTDNPNSRHAPSGYQSENIFAVGGFVLDSLNTSRTPVRNGAEVSGIAIKGSYGVEAVDIAAPFDGYNLALLDMHRRGRASAALAVELQGTSYATPFVLTKIAVLMAQNENRTKAPIEIKNLLLESALISDKLKTKVGQGRVMLRETP